MSATIHSLQSKRWLANIAIIYIFLSLLFPAVPVSKCFSIRAEDLLVFPVFFIIIKEHLLRSVKLNLLLLIYGSIIALSIIINRKAGIYNDVFEIADVFRMFFILQLFLIADLDQRQLYKWSALLLALLFIFNLAHYTDLFHFNTYVTPSYADPTQLGRFGRDSLGNSATKRMMGTLGNPNQNAVLFGVFSLASICFFNRRITGMVFIFASSFLFFLCQSRGAFIAFIISFLLIIVVSSFSRVDIIKIIGILAVSFICFYMIDSAYIQSIASGHVMQSDSATERIRIWKLLWQEFLTKPFFGSGPSKNFFYTNHIYPEGEWIFMLFRYGLTGMIVYISILFHNIFNKQRNLLNPYSVLLFALGCFYLLDGIVNTPFSEPRLNALFFALSGIGLKQSMSNPSGT